MPKKFGSEEQRVKSLLPSLVDWNTPLPLPGGFVIQQDGAPARTARWMSGLPPMSPVRFQIITVWTVVQAVLTATFNSYGNRQISTPTKSVPLNQSKKIRHSWLRPREDPLYQIWYRSTHWKLLGKWVKYNKNYFYLYLFFLRLAYRSDRLMDFYAR